MTREYKPLDMILLCFFDEKEFIVTGEFDNVGEAEAYAQKEQIPQPYKVVEAKYWEPNEAGSVYPPQ